MRDFTFLRCVSLPSIHPSPHPSQGLLNQRGKSIEILMITQVFVANPNKSPAVQRILISNRDRLLRFLPNFLDDRMDDDQFMDEKSFLIRQIELLPAQQPPSAGVVADERVAPNPAIRG